MATLHTYEAEVVWTGDLGVGTATYSSYSRDHEVRLNGRPPLPGSSDPAFRGDPSRFSPEELLLAALSQCHLLWFLHLASAARVVVVGYADRATAAMAVDASGGGQFTEALLRPAVTLAASDAGAPGLHPGDDTLADLHRRAHELCFIARSVSFPVRCEPAPVRIAGAER